MGLLGRRLLKYTPPLQDATSKASLLHIEHFEESCDAYGCVRTYVGETRVVATAWLT
jgi:hypothetical protein